MTAWLTPMTLNVRLISFHISVKDSVSRSPMTNKEQMTKLLELASKATPGPWRLEPKIEKLESGKEWTYYEIWHSPDGTFHPEDTYSLHDNNTEGTQTYIAACSPDVITALCERLQKYEEALEHIGSDDWVCGECMTPGK